MDEVTDPSLSVLAEGHQWYWSYEYPDFLNSDGDFVEFDSYLVPESDLKKGSSIDLVYCSTDEVPTITEINETPNGQGPHGRCSHPVLERRAFPIPEDKTLQNMNRYFEGNTTKCRGGYIYTHQPVQCTSCYRIFCPFGFYSCNSCPSF